MCHIKFDTPGSFWDVVHVPGGRPCFTMRLMTRLNASQKNWPAHILMAVISRVKTARAAYEAWLFVRHALSGVSCDLP